MPEALVSDVHFPLDSNFRLFDNNHFVSTQRSSNVDKGTEQCNDVRCHNHTSKASHDAKA